LESRTALYSVADITESTEPPLNTSHTVDLPESSSRDTGSPSPPPSSQVRRPVSPEAVHRSTSPLVHSIVPSAFTVKVCYHTVLHLLYYMCYHTALHLLYYTILCVTIQYYIYYIILYVLPYSTTSTILYYVSVTSPVGSSRIHDSSHSTSC